MVKGLRLYPLTRVFLKGVVADGLRRVHGFLNVTWFKAIHAMLASIIFVVMVGPDPCVEISLKLQTNRETVILNFGNTSFFAVDEVCLAREFLNMVSCFMSNDVGVSEVSTLAKFAVHLVKE